MNKPSLPVLYGIFTAGGLIAYFLLLLLFGLHVNPAYSIFNLVILGVGLYLVVNKYKKVKGDKFKFQKGIMTGLMTGFIATAIFTAFFAVYASELNPDYINELITMWDTDWLVDVGMVIVTVALMGIASTAVISFAFVQLIKPTHNTEEGRKHTY